MNDHDIVAADELRFIRDVLARTESRVDPHAFHFIIWGTLVLLCYPALNWLENAGRLAAMAWLGGGALALGALLSFALELRLARNPRLRAENTFVSRQVTRIVFANIGIGALLSAIGPGSGLVAPDAVPVVWGLAYANMAYMIGVVYRPEYLVAGVAIAVGAFAAWLAPGYRGYILGPFMGLGMIIPGVLAERRVARMRE